MQEASRADWIPGLREAWEDPRLNSAVFSSVEARSGHEKACQSKWLSWEQISEGDLELADREGAVTHTSLLCIVYLCLHVVGTLFMQSGPQVCSNEPNAGRILALCLLTVSWRELSREHGYGNYILF